MEVMIRSSDEAFEDRPDILDVVRRSKLPHAMVARGVRIPEELVQTLVARSSVCPDEGCMLDVREDEPIRRSLFPIKGHAKDNPL